MPARLGFALATPVILKRERKGLYAMAVIDSFTGFVEFAMSANPLRIVGRRVKPATGDKIHKLANMFVQN
jgi:hypothetical protein